jgi:hypothetical protein
MITIPHIITGSAGLGASQLASTIPTDGTMITEVIKIVVQLIIGFLTVRQMTKKPKT